MYRCTDCGQEFEIKPEYCDCGNNVFEEIVHTAPAEPAREPAVTPRPPKAIKRIVDLPSLLIFLTCILLSVLSWIFIGRDDAKTQLAETPVHKPKTTVEIPSIDELWKETPTVKKVEPQTVQPQVVQPAVAVPKNVVPKKEKTQVVKTPVSAKTTPVKTAPSVTTQPKQTTTAMTEEQKQAIIKKLTTTQTPQKKAEPVKKAESVKTVETKPAPKTEAPKVDYAAQKRELAAYKVALRNKIGGNINFAAVIGDGRCAITFKLDSAGNLINRAFSVQSDNDSLNDAVYAAMMQNPTFKAPPEGYKNETLTLSVQIYGGQFEVALR